MSLSSQTQKEGRSMQSIFASSVFAMLVVAGLSVSGCKAQAGSSAPQSSLSQVEELNSPAEAMTEAPVECYRPAVSNR